MVWYHQWSNKVSRDTDRPSTKMHLQCISGIHFNPVFSRKGDEHIVHLVVDKNINSINQTGCEKDKVEEEVDEDDDEEDVGVLISFQQLKVACRHSLSPLSSCVVNLGNHSVCAMIDTGAQVSLISKGVYGAVKEERNLQMTERKEGIVGISRNRTDVAGIVFIRVKLLSYEVENSVPFAIIEDGRMPCCCLLGANFLSSNNITIDYGRQMLVAEGKELPNLEYPLGQRKAEECLHRYDVFSFLGQISIGEDETNLDKIKYMISDQTLVVLQREDRAISSAKRNIVQTVPLNQWKYPFFSSLKEPTETTTFVMEY